MYYKGLRFQKIFGIFYRALTSNSALLPFWVFVNEVQLSPVVDNTERPTSFTACETVTVADWHDIYDNFIDYSCQLSYKIKKNLELFEASRSFSARAEFLVE